MQIHCFFWVGLETHRQQFTILKASLSRVFCEKEIGQHLKQYELQFHC